MSQYELLCNNESRYKTGVQFTLRDVISEPMGVTGTNFFKAVQNGTDDRLKNVRNIGTDASGKELYEVVSD